MAVTVPPVHAWASAWGAVPRSRRKGAGADPSTAVIGGYAESASSDILGEWTYDYFKPAYGAQVEWVASPGTGTTSQLLRRERPKVLLGGDGEPTWLYNGVALSLEDGTAGVGIWNTFTFAQQIVAIVT